MLKRRFSVPTILFFLCAAVCYAQFGSSITGTVEDPTGGLIPRATVTLLNVDTNVVLKTQADESGTYRFVSLAPGRYRLTAEAAGFSRGSLDATLETGQSLNLPLKVAVAGVSQDIVVTGQAPVMNTEESRNQLTIESQALSALPLAGRSMISLVTLAPGTTGLGVAASGSPGSGVDNYSTETQVDASANGQGSVGNMFVVDGLDVTSAIRPGVLNLTPNPDSIQETSIQTNTFTVDYGRASSIQMILTTKSGSDRFHGSISDYFTNQHLFAGTEFVHNYAPFHSNNVSGSIGGPIIPHHQFFFFFSIEPLRSSQATGNSLNTFEDPQFTQWAQVNYPNTLGTKLLTTYKPSGATVTGVAQTGATLFPGTCGTAATNFLPCSLNVTDNGVFNSTNFRNGTQWDLRIDKYFNKDRIYGSFYRTTLNYGGANLRPQFTTSNDTVQYALQINETHSFSPTTLNEAAFGVNRVEGVNSKTGDFSVPVVNVTGQSAGFGTGFAQGDFIQHNYHWRDVLSRVQGSHEMKFGYEGWFGDDVENFQGPYAQPNFTFNNLLNLVQDQPYTEGNIRYDPVSGKAVLWDWNAASRTWGLFAEDTWKVARNFTLTYGIRWDDFGNPYSRDPLTVFGNFILGQGSALAQQVASGHIVAKQHALNGAIANNWSPRAGFSWDPGGNGTWVIRGGAGVYHNWPTQANVQEEYRGNPPGPIQPTFYAGSATPPLFVLGDGSKKPPFGFTYPTIPPNQLDSAGGIVGAQLLIGAINPNLISPVTYNFSGTVERKIVSKIVGSVGYSGSHADNLLSGGSQVSNVSYGVDINSFAGDLVQNNSTTPTRLNPSFGQILYTTNDRYSNYNAVIFDVRGRYSRGFFDASYTRSSSNDDAGVYPTALNPGQYYGPSLWDAPNRFSLSWSYEIPGLNQNRGLVGRLTGGWALSGTTIIQSGNPFTVANSAPFSPLRNAAGTIIGLAPGSGDYNADGDNASGSGITAIGLDYPNVSSYKTPTSRNAYLNGLFSAGQFTAPALGTEGNEKINQFRGPNFAESDVALSKDTTIAESVKVQLRFEFYNIFNRPNLSVMDQNLNDASFGKATKQLLPRWIQFGAKITF